MKLLRIGLIPICLGVLLTTGTVNYPAQAETPPPCAEQTGPPGPVTPTTVDTVAQAYRCVLDHYVRGSTVDDRELLRGAFAGLTQELGRRGLEQADATMPALTGDRDDDWAAFAAAYQRVTGAVPDPTARQAIATATITGMLAALHDNHVGWVHPVFPPNHEPGQGYGLGLSATPASGLVEAAPGEALPPLYVTRVTGGPAAAHGLRPGDVIEAVNGAPPFVDGIPSQGVQNLLYQAYPRNDEVRLTLRRPATGRMWTVTMRPSLFTPTANAFVTPTLLDGDVAGIRLAGFAPHSADQVLAAIAALGEGRTLRGVVLDLRGNTGGSPDEVARLLGGWTHDTVYRYTCDGADHCTPVRTDDTVRLLSLPIVVLTDRDCASACDSFASAVKDLHLGAIIGTRTAGIVSGPAAAYVLNDNSQVRMPSQHDKAANGEVIDGIGVAPDIYLPRTPHDLSTGHDPAVTTALTLLHH